MTTLERLQPEPVLDTVRRLESRIAARFPDRGLRRVAAELVTLTADVQRIAPALAVRGDPPAPSAASWRCWSWPGPWWP